MLQMQHNQRRSRDKKHQINQDNAATIKSYLCPLNVVTYLSIKNPFWLYTGQQTEILERKHSHLTFKQQNVAKMQKLHELTSKHVISGETVNG